MAYDKLRQRIAWEAARLMYEHQESFHRAKFQAAQKLVGGWIHPRLLPSHREIRAEIENMARLHEVTDDRLFVPPETTDRFQAYASLLMPLEAVKQPAKTHPEGD